MRELFLSVGITLLTSTLLFVYFRNKHNTLDEKVSLVFTTIQEHNEKMQQAAEEEMQRMAEYQRHQHMQMQMMSGDLHEEQELTVENVENLPQNSETHNLIDVSDDENNDNFDSDNDSDENDSDDNDSDDESEDENNEENSEQNNHLEVLETVDLEKTKQIEISLLPETDYTKMTKSKLKEMCEERSVDFKSSFNKGKLIQLLIDNDNSNKLTLG